MISPRTLPTLMIVLSLLSAATYAWHDIADWRHILYWLAAATLTFTVTY